MAEKEPTKSPNRVRPVKAFTLSTDVFNDIVEIAEAENRSVSNTVETALKQWASSRKKEATTVL